MKKVISFLTPVNHKGHIRMNLITCHNNYPFITILGTKCTVFTCEHPSSNNNSYMYHWWTLKINLDFGVKFFNFLSVSLYTLLYTVQTLHKLNICAADGQIWTETYGNWAKVAKTSLYTRTGSYRSIFLELYTPWAQHSRSPSYPQLRNSLFPDSRFWVRVKC